MVILSFSGRSNPGHNSTGYRFGGIENIAPLFRACECRFHEGYKQLKGIELLARSQ